MSWQLLAISVNTAFSSVSSHEIPMIVMSCALGIHFHFSEPSVHINLTINTNYQVAGLLHYFKSTIGYSGMRRIFTFFNYVEPYYKLLNKSGINNRPLTKFVLSAQNNVK